ncbi:MAG: hypothetical protein PHU44_01125 [Syntrophales bacterium]|nr:hypothetical protein [Syntrophales bacterium]MDD5641410.1 hypothetical protein [Syntrophales bacterium]
MDSHFCKKLPKFFRLWVVFLILLLGCSYGCQTKEPPLSPAAARFKQEVKECIDLVTKALLGPLAKGDAAGIHAALKKTEPENLKLCVRCPFRMGVMDVHGNSLAIYPPKKNTNLDFYRYEVVQQVLKDRKIAQQRLYLQDGSGLYVICVPLLKNNEVLGILAIALSASEARNKWGLTEKEFLALDFNR